VQQAEAGQWLDGGLPEPSGTVGDVRL